MKLVVPEAESAPLRAALIGLRLTTSELTVTELRRAVLRRLPGALRVADGLLDPLALLPLDRPLLDRAGTLPPPELRSLDALHLASALQLGPGLDVLVTYDVRLAAAARAAGVPVQSPGAP